MSAIKLEIVTPERIAFSEDINVLIAPAVDGEIGILPGHTPLVTGLKTGVLHIKKGEEEIAVSISEGFMEVKPEQINVVVRTAELYHEIDIERAEKARERARQRLEGDHSEIDVARAEGALERAVVRLRAAGKNRD